jgi:hypothetical protein
MRGEPQRFVLQEPPADGVLRLYPFRFFDLVTRRWWRARYVAEFNDIVARYPAFQITGRPELRERGETFPGLFRP